MFRVSKTMNRPLTDEEKAEVEKFILEDLTRNVPDTIKYFEERFGMPVTETCINKIVIELVMKGKI